MFKAEQVSDETAPCGCRMIRHVYKEMPGLTLVTGHDCDKRPVQAWEVDWHDGFIFDMDVALRIYGSPSFEVGTTSETPLTQISLKG